MGTFAGHAIPGTAFVLWGGWWYGQTLRQIARSRESSSQAGEDVPGTADAWEIHASFAPLEPAVKIAVPLAAAVGELWWASWRLVDSSITNYQHATMYLGFTLAGVVDLLERKGRLPKNSAHVALVAALIMEAVLFLGHANPPGLERTVHHLLVYTMIAAAVMLVLELRYRSPFFTVGKSYALVLQGTWFWQIAYMLFAADYDPTHHASMMLAQTFFAWHAIVVAGVMLVAYLAVNPPRRL